MEQKEELAERFQSSLRRIMRCYKAVFTHQMAGYSVTMPQFHLLKFVEHREDVTVTDISGLMMASPPTVSRMIEGLCVKELLEKSKGDDDHRVTFLKLTRKGKALMRKMETEQREILNNVLEGEDTVMLEATISELEKISEKWLEVAKEKMEKDPYG